jgi:hypothetical protein
LLGYSRSFTHRKDGPGAARPWWVQGEALAAGGDLAGFSSGQGIASFFLRKRRILFFSEEKNQKTFVSAARRVRAI